VQAGALAGMAVAFIVVLCMSGNYVVVRHRRDVGMAPAIWLAGVISGLVALPFAEPTNVTWQQLPWLLALSPGQLAGGLLLYMASLKRIPAGQAALLGLLELVLGGRRQRGPSSTAGQVPGVNRAAVADHRRDHAGGLARSIQEPRARTRLDDARFVVARRFGVEQR
jgi:hypothetical protein